MLHFVPCVFLCVCFYNYWSRWPLLVPSVWPDFRGFLLTLGPWALFSWNVYIRKLVIVNVFSVSLRQIFFKKALCQFRNQTFFLQGLRNPLRNVIKEDSTPISQSERRSLTLVGVFSHMEWNGHGSFLFLWANTDRLWSASHCSL